MATNKDKKLLVIVESPNKVKSITSILKAAGYTKAAVSASVGHIMELGDGGSCYNSGIYPEKNFEMNLKISADKKKVVEDLKLKVKAADIVCLMTDGDREGEVIAWSLVKFLRIPKTKYVRCVTHEITPKAVVQAIENPVELDLNLVNAGLSRMMLDKLIGYGLSPMGRRYIGAKSIGRCQSIGLALVCDREREIENFIPEKYFDLYLRFEKDNLKFKAKYIGTDEKPSEHLYDQNEVNNIINDCSANTNFYISNIKNRIKQESPKPPFCTATFQQEAASKLGLKVKDAMSCAQKLFEGINIGKEHTGLITYMRTDSTDFAPEFIPDLKQYITTTFGADQYTKPRTGKKTGDEQDGHECLRVVDLSLTPEKLSTYITNNLLIKVYNLIWCRTVASAMPNAQISETTYLIKNGKHNFSLISNELRVPGYRVVYGLSETQLDDVIKTTWAQNEVLQNTDLESVAKTTQPKPRYTEASLIKELQTRGIGRPSTYATIVETILSPNRGYANLEDKSIVPTNLGMQLAAFCDRSFAHIINYDYTRTMEESLDKIASGKSSWLDYMINFYADLEATIKTNKETEAPQQADKLCPLCGAKMVVRRNRWGKLFYGCSKYPKCVGILGN